jgi:hypothetical protein
MQENSEVFVGLDTSKLKGVVRLTLGFLRQAHAGQSEPRCRLVLWREISRNLLAFDT